MATIKIINNTDTAFSIEGYDNVSIETIQAIKAIIDQARVNGTLFDKTAFSNSACINCSNNPKNGGSGVCNCILGNIVTY